MDIRQILLVCIVFAIPLWLMAKQRDDLIVKWVCLTIAVNIFDPHLIVNAPAARVVGLLVLPSSIAALPAVRKITAGKALWVYLLYLGFMGVVFGFVFPWSSEGFDRLPTQLSQVRAVVYFFRKTADFSLAIFLARYLWKTRRPDRLIEWFVYGTSIAAVGGFVQRLTGLDPYAIITGADLLDLDDRMRGFNYEPRGLGLIVGQGLLFALLLYARNRSGKRLAIVLLHIVALFLAVSTSSIFVVAVGAAALLFFDPGSRKILATAKVLILVPCAALLLFSLQSGFVESWYSNVELRLSEKSGSAPGSGIEDFALRQDLFDSAAIMFFVAQPQRLLTGVGPGLSGLATTDYLPASDLFGWVLGQSEGLNTVPQVGLLREACDVGVVGLILGWIFVSASGRALLQLSESSAAGADQWQIGRAAFWAAVAMYLVQASPLSASFSVFLGIGLAASWVAASRQVPPAARGTAELAV
jgi:hypothetical protein